MFSSYFLIGQNLVSIECKEKKDTDVICFWYLVNEHDKTVEVVYKRTKTDCQDKTEEKIKTLKLKPKQKKTLGFKDKNTCENKSANYGKIYTIVSTKFIKK